MDPPDHWDDQGTGLLAIVSGLHLGTAAWAPLRPKLVLSVCRLQTGKSTLLYKVLPALLRKHKVFGQKGPREALICKIEVPVSSHVSPACNC
jgi:hypothetical protein